MDEIDYSGEEHEEALGVHPHREGPGNRDQYLQELEAKLEEWDESIEELQERAERLKVNSILLASVLEKRKEVNRNLEALRNAAEEEWDHFTAQVAASTQDLQDAIHRVKPRIEGKVAAGTSTQPPRHQLRKAKRNPRTSVKRRSL